MLNRVKQNLILLVNLGSPKSPSIKDIRAFLSEFLSDRRVVGLPKIIWYPILYGIILLFRPRKLVHKYKQIWLENNETGEKGKSPLIYYTEQQAKQLDSLLNDDNLIVKSAFLYSYPTLIDVISQLESKDNLKSITVLPLYPQYSSTTTAPVFDFMAKYYKNKKYLPSIKFINNFYKNPLFIEAIANKIIESQLKTGAPEKLIFSYHSSPVSLIAAGDTYYQECIETSELIAEKLNLRKEEYIIAFQSKFGANKWLTPATIEVVKELAMNKIKKVDIVCPGFVADCLETLEEIAITNKNVFITNGGIEYNYIQCLNDDWLFTNVLKNVIEE